MGAFPYCLLRFRKQKAAKVTSLGKGFGLKSPCSHHDTTAKMAPSAVKKHAKESCTSIGSGPFSPLPWPRAMFKQYLARTSLMSTALTKLTIIIIHFYISDLILYVCLNMYAYRYPSIYCQAVWFDIHAEELCKWVLVSSIKILDNGENGSSLYIIQYSWS